MDIYSSRSNWKITIITLSIIIVLVTVFYANYLANQLEMTERKKSQLYVEVLNELSTIENLNQEIGFLQTYMDSFDLPTIIVAEDGTINSGNGWGESIDTNLQILQDKIESFNENDGIKLKGPGGYAEDIYVFNSPTLTYVRYFPIVQIFLVTFFILLAYFLFNSSRRAEQNRVWAGMAKETAHQLGTPISAILGWIEHLKLLVDNQPEEKEILEELISDVNRLELVADRFSKIGSAPILKRIDLYSEVVKCKNYMQRRSPKRVQYMMQDRIEPIIYVMINEHLFDWVIENLLRNALDAMDGQGKISIRLFTEDGQALIELSDTGKGIPANKFKSVFKPGFSTKQRGWGLGLSLAKRIIEEYHKGKIYVKSSKINEGTTFSIKLPLANA